MHPLTYPQPCRSSECAPTTGHAPANVLALRHDTKEDYARHPCLLSGLLLTKVDEQISTALSDCQQRAQKECMMAGRPEHLYVILAVVKSLCLLLGYVQSGAHPR